MSTFQIFPNFGRGGGVIENQIFPKFKIVHIILGGGGGARKLWTFSTIWDISCLEGSPNAELPLFFKLLSHLSPAVSGEIFD